MRKLTKFTVVLLALLMVGGMFQPAIHAFSEIRVMSKDITEYAKANIEIFNQNKESLGKLEYEIKGKPIYLPFLKKLEILEVIAEEKTSELLNVKITVKMPNKIVEQTIKVAIKLWNNSVNGDITKETKVVFTRDKWNSGVPNANIGNPNYPIKDDYEQTEEPKQPDIPLTPLTPSEPVEPEQKDIPLTPLTPSEPVEPEQPEEPGTETPEEPQEPGKEEPQPEEPGTKTPEEPQPEEPEQQELTEELLKEIADKVSELISENKEEEIDEYIDSLKLSEEDKDRVNNIINKLKEELKNPKEEPQPEEPEDPGKEEPGKEEPQPKEPGKEEPGKEEPGKEEPQPEEPQPEEPGKEEPGKEEPQPDEPIKEDLGKQFNTGKVINKEEFRDEFLRLINEKRISVGVNPLKLGVHLEKGSELRAKEMADHGSLRGGEPTEDDPKNENGKHKRPNGEDSFRTAFDYLENYEETKGRNLGENILEKWIVSSDEESKKDFIGDSKSLAKDMFDAWAASPGHYRNMVNANYKTTWVSVAADEVEDDKLLLIGQNVFDILEDDVPLN